VDALPSEDYEHRIALIGCGTVGEAFLELLDEKQDHLREKGFTYKVVGVADSSYSVFDEEGIDVQEVLDAESLREVGAEVEADHFATSDEVDVVVEATPTDLDTGEPGMGFVVSALENGKDVVTCNKGPLALKYDRMNELAGRNDAILKYSGTVMAGTPSLELYQNLKAAEIQSVRGIVNGTSNYILTEMSKGREFEEVLQEAKQKGYAEADPTADVEGHDAAAKLSILSAEFFGEHIPPEEIPKTSVREAEVEEGSNVKPVAEVKKENGELKAEVKLEDVGDLELDVDGVMNALEIESDHLGSTTVKGAGAAGRETAHALLNDLTQIPY
jgi:homoserine dehydrogenase